MPSYRDRVFQALGRFQTRLAMFDEAVKHRAADPPRLPKKALDELTALAARVRVASDALSVSLGHIVDQRGVDLVDMQVRLRGESAKLADALGRLGDTVSAQHFVREAFSESLVALDEAAQQVAAAVFPSAVQGLRDVNVRLWDFQKIQQIKYGQVLEAVVQKKRLTLAQQSNIEAIGARVIGAFDDVNALLNELAESRATDGRRLKRRLADMTKTLNESLADAERRLTDEVKMFKKVISDSAKIAADVTTLLAKVVVPIFPPHDGLGPLTAAVTPDLYDGLSGVQAFALLNIAARMRATRVAGTPLLDASYRIRVTDVFPDRIYFEADKAIIDHAKADSAFKEAPAALHRFKEGSLKQRTFTKGNLQFSYESRAEGKVMVDADLDLYRDAIPHLFGEVLVNHLTGSTTNQFAVREILDDQDVLPIGDFELLGA